MRTTLLSSLGVWGLWTVPLVAQPPVIDHAPAACAVADRFPKLEALFTPADSVAKARVVFQGANPAEWFSVDMKSEESRFVGVLPQPRSSLKAFRYYLEVTDKALGTARTEEYETAVVSSASLCRGRVTALALGAASVLLNGPAGVVAVPLGFASNGVVMAGAAAAAGGGSAAGAAGASAAGAGGGVGATALVVGGLAVAGGAAVAVTAGGGGGDGDSASSGPGSSGNNNSLWSVLFLPSPPGIDVSSCAGRPVTWCCQNVSADANGNFDQTWAPNEPNTARINGRVTSTSFQATIACTNGATSGSISATGSGSSFSGSFSFGSSNGQVTVTRQP